MTETVDILDPEDWLFAALIDMVIAHCETSEHKLDSFGWPANQTAMRLLADAGFIEIKSEQDDGRIEADVLAAARALSARVARAEAARGKKT